MDILVQVVSMELKWMWIALNHKVEQLKLPEAREVAVLRHAAQTSKGAWVSHLLLVSFVKMSGYPNWVILMFYFILLLIE
jgi:hypothetical protein